MSDGQISIVRPGGAAVTVVPVTERVANRRPTLSPDGEQVAYTRFVDGRQTIFRARLDGTGERRLRRGSLPRWSPGGRNMMFLAPNGRVQVMRAATGRIFHRHHNFFATGFDWRPDGHRMVFASRGGDLFVIPPKEPGTPQRLLAHRRARVFAGVVARHGADRLRARPLDLHDARRRRQPAADLPRRRAAVDQLAAAALGHSAYSRAARGSGG